MSGPLIQESTRFRARNHLSADVSGETVILHDAEAAYYGLNSTGTLLWRQLKEPKSSGQLVRLVAEEFQLDPGVVEADVVSVLAEMLEAGLIEVVPEGATA